MRRTLPLAITMIVGLIMIIGGMFNLPDFSQWTTTYIVRSMTISQATASAIGVLSLTRLHINRIARKRDGWYNSVILVVCVFWFLLMGFYFDRGQNSPFYRYWYLSLPTELGNMTFALICFYIASAAYRAFRMRSLESSMLLISATLVMLGGTSVGNAISGGFLPATKTWIMDYLNTAAVRGLQLGVTLGSLAQAARNLFGIERGYMAE